jgi:TatD DNase family protein
MTGTDAPGSGLVDTHAHLADRELSRNLGEILGRARSAGVVQVVAVGTTAEDSVIVHEQAARARGVFATVGIHPNHAGDARPGDWEKIEALSRLNGVVGVGETGLDRYRDHTPFSQQQQWFGKHLALAHERELPVVIHCRESEADIIAQLAGLGRPVRGVLHSFSGTWEQAEAFLELGLDLSFAGMVTFTNKSLDRLREVASRVPLDRILVETDSPYLSPHPFRGQPNEPARVALTAEQLAGLRGLTPAEFAAITTRNARRLFSLPDVTL